MSTTPFDFKAGTDRLIGVGARDRDSGRAADQDAVAELRCLAGPMFDAMDHCGVAMAVFDAQRAHNPIIFVNAAFTQLTGWSAADAIGRGGDILHGPQTNLAAIARIAAAFGSASAIETEILHYRKNGGRFWNAMAATPIEDSTGEVAFFLVTHNDVTEQHDAAVAAALSPDAAALAESRERLRIALSFSGIAAAWEWHIADRRVVGDMRFALLYGLTEAEAARGVPASTFFSVVHPEDEPRIRLAVGAMLRGAQVFSKEYRLQLPDGTMRWVHARGRCHYDDQDRPVRFSGVLVDITEQKRAEERLRIAETAGGVGTFAFVEGFGTVSVSPEFCSLLGLFRSRDLPVRTINAVVLPNDPLIIDAHASALPGTVAEAEFRIRRPDNGETRWLMRRGEYLRDLETSDLRFCGVIYDITHAKQIEQELRTLNETLETRVEERTRERDRIWQVSPDLHVLCDGDGICKSVNPAWQRELGYPIASLLGRKLADFIYPDDRAAIDSAVLQLRRAEGVANVDARVVVTGGGIRDFSWTFVPEQGQFFAAGRDVTHRNELEAQLRQSQKMEAVGQLTGGIAHDFNNLLTGIAGGMGFLRTRIAQGRLEEAERYITAAETAAERAASLTHRLLAFSRQQALEPKSTQANALVRDVQDLVQRTVGPQIAVETRLAADLWLTRCDPNQLENAVLNLAINARDAMPEGGRLMIESENVTLDGQAAAAHTMEPGEYVTISVADTGCGIPSDVLPRVFDPFFTTKPLGQGTGLGLSMVYGFVKQSGGGARVRSNVGAGTTVTLFLRRYEGAEPAGPATALSNCIVAGVGGRTIVVVDDEPFVAMLVVDVVEELGHVALDLPNAKSALEVLQSDCHVDMLITDIGLPGDMNGRQLADLARRARPGLKTLFVTGYARGGALADTNLESGMHVMTKPFSPELLARRIQEIVSGP
ncbi:MAG TPA: PAS domain S-box protein [Acetobacteraceae bacterium]|nr:PAS domain S-box protein [Acetobacteraceae bacterium]